MTGPRKDPAHQALKALRNIHDQLGFVQRRLSRSQTHADMVPTVKRRRNKIGGMVKHLEEALNDD